MTTLTKNKEKPTVSTIERGIVFISGQILMTAGSAGVGAVFGIMLTNGLSNANPDNWIFVTIYLGITIIGAAILFLVESEKIATLDQWLRQRWNGIRG